MGEYNCGVEVDLRWVSTNCGVGEDLRWVSTTVGWERTFYG